MHDLNEFRKQERVAVLVDKIKSITNSPWHIMEICGGQTHSIAKYRLSDLLPEEITLIHGPGCPVCVTPKSIIDTAIHIARQPEVIFCTFGDMMRVPGSEYDLLIAKAKGADIRMLYSPLEAVEIARKQPGKQIVLFAVGFETTAPAHAMAVIQAASLQLSNFSVLVSLVLVPPAMRFLLETPQHQINGFLAAGHVCTIMGESAYHPICAQYKIPIVITGFEPVDILNGLYHCILQLESNQATVENQYARIVTTTGNLAAQRAIFEVFTTFDMPWRGIGTIPQSGLQLKSEYTNYDARYRFSTQPIITKSDQGCISGLVLQGRKKPYECPLFGKTCTPESPVGAPMVSTEGACSAYYLYAQDVNHVI